MEGGKRESVINHLAHKDRTLLCALMTPCRRPSVWHTIVYSPRCLRSVQIYMKATYKTHGLRDLGIQVVDSNDWLINDLFGSIFCAFRAITM